VHLSNLFRKTPRELPASGVVFEKPRLIRSLDDCYFYHTTELPEFGIQQGHWDLRGRFDDYIGQVDVDGKSVLDIGTATGFLSFEAERRGATRVVSFDMSDIRQQTFVPFPNKRAKYDPAGWRAEYSGWMERWKNAYWLCHRVFGSRAEVFYGDILELPPALGRFDVVIVGSVLEHLRDPVQALESIVRVTGETLVVVTPILEQDEPVAQFEPRAANADQDFTWWTYSRGLYRELLGILGFEIERITVAEYWHEYAQRNEPRTTLVARRR
jgi:SAM-dependent methyltransferase